MSISEFQFQQMLNKQAVKERNPSDSGNEPVAAGQELKLHDDIIDFCNRQWPHWVYIHANPTGRSTIQKGAPDFIIFGDDFTAIIECKTRTGKSSPDQLAFAAKLKRVGQIVHIVRSMADFHAVIAVEKQMKGTRL